MFCIFSRCLTKHIMSIIVLQVLCEPSCSLTVILTLCAVDNSSSIIYGHTHILFILSYRHTHADAHARTHTRVCVWLCCMPLDPCLLPTCLYLFPLGDDPVTLWSPRQIFTVLVPNAGTVKRRASWARPLTRYGLAPSGTLQKACYHFHSLWRFSLLVSTNVMMRHIYRKGLLITPSLDYARGGSRHKLDFNTNRREFKAVFLLMLNCVKMWSK